MEELAGVLEADTIAPDQAAAIELIVQVAEEPEAEEHLVQEVFLVSQDDQDLRAYQECQSI